MSALFDFASHGGERITLRQSRSLLLGGTALSLFMALAQPASAQNVHTFNGAAAVNTSGLVGGGALWSIPISGTTVANVTTTDINTGLFNAIWTAQIGLNGTQTITVGAGRTVTGNTAILSTAFTDKLNITNNGTLNSTVLDTIFAQNFVSGDITVSGSGVTNAARNGMWLITPSGTVLVGAAGAPVGAVDAGLNGIVVTGNVGPVTIHGSSVTGAAGNGIWVLTAEGEQNINASGLITAGLNGVLAGSTTGNITTGTNGIDSAGFGIVTVTGTGNTTVVDAATIEAVNTGIWTTGSTGNTSVTANSVVSTSNYGIFSTSTSGNNTISTTGDISGATDGIFSVSSSGNNLVTGNGSSIVNGGIEGIYINATTTGNATVTNFASITGDRAGIWTLVGAGVTSIQGNGPITGNGNWGVLAQAMTGDVNVGNTAFNGVITGALIGLQATSGSGDINVATNADVTGTGNIGIFTSTSGNTVNSITAGNVTGGIWGMDTLAQGTGNITNTIAAGSTVSGGAIGLVTGTISGVSTTTNAGIVTTTGDTGAPGMIGGLANSNVAGTNIVNNSGQLIGGVATAGLAYTLNNAAGAVWTPSANGNAFGSINDTVNNSGTINIRTGITTFAGLDALNNQAGGHINLAYAPAATDTLTVFNFAPNAGSAATFNFNATLANNAGLGFDNTGNGLGTADTIVVAGIVTTQASSTINLVTTGAPTSQTGSVALIYTGVNLTAPAVGATITPSSVYTFGTGAPAPGALAYFLVDDGRGGVYLQWAPNTSARTLGGYGGGVGPGSASNPSGAIASGAAGAAGIGGVGLTGGPGGGGAAGQVADMAAASALPFGSASQSGECGRARFMTAWGAIEGSKSTSDGGGSGSNRNLSGGVDADVSTALGLRCNQLALGAFAVAGESDASWGSGSSESSNTGVGGYVRASTSIGLYASLLGASSWADQSLYNNALSASADRDAATYAGVASLGFMTGVGATTAIDVRGFASFANTKGDGFTDSVGLTVTSSRDKITTYGASIGLYQSFSPTVYGFVRGGVKWADLESSITAYTVTQTGNSNSTVGSFEAGLNGTLTSNTTVGARGFTDVGDALTNYGGKLDLTVKF